MGKRRQKKRPINYMTKKLLQELIEKLKAEKEKHPKIAIAIALETAQRV